MNSVTPLGFLELRDGVSVVAIAMGLFGVAEVISSIREAGKRKIMEKVSMRSMLPTRDDMRKTFAPMARGSSIGGFLGALPGAGTVIAPSLAYSTEVRLAKDMSRDPYRLIADPLTGSILALSAFLLKWAAFSGVQNLLKARRITDMPVGEA